MKEMVIKGMLLTLLWLNRWIDCVNNNYDALYYTF